MAEVKMAADHQSANVGSRSCRFKSTGQHLVYTPAVEIGDLKSPSLIFDAVTHVWDSAELLKQKAGKRLIRPRYRQGNSEQMGGFDRGHPTGDQIRAVVALYGGSLAGPVFRTKRADNRFEDIGTRHDTLENPIFVVHQSDVHRCIAQDRNHIPRIES